MGDNNGRGVVQPIRDKRDLENCINYLKEQTRKTKSSKTRYIKDRNYTLFIIGINTALRISDLLSLKVKNVKNGYINIREQKTNKVNQIVIHNELQKIIISYIKRYNISDSSYLFQSRKGFNKPITKTHAYRLMKELQSKLKINYPIGTHTLRKSFGYHYYKSTNNVVALQKMLNHSDPQTTLIYIGMIQTEVDKEREGFKLGI